MYQTLIASTDLADHLNQQNWVIVDCRFDLGDTSAGHRAYLQGHIPGAVYAHLDDDLSGPPVTDKGRHPLPTPAALAALFGRLGIDASVQVVVYDSTNGMIASRLWWMLRYMGHDAVAVLDGGWQAWKEAGLPVQTGAELNSQRLFTGAPQSDWLVQMADVDSVSLLIDSRDGARFRGEMETLDPAAGHIPGAVNLFFQEMWGENGRYLPADTIREKLAALLGSTAAGDVVFYCGSGVSACVNMLAMTHAGLGNGRLYVGSWSEWSRTPGKPIATGSE